jgi:hypothetical protein
MNKSQKHFVWGMSTVLILVYGIGLLTTAVLVYLELGERGD